MKKFIDWFFSCNYFGSLIFIIDTVYYSSKLSSYLIITVTHWLWSAFRFLGWVFVCLVAILLYSFTQWLAYRDAAKKTKISFKEAMEYPYF